MSRQQYTAARLMEPAVTADALAKKEIHTAVKITWLQEQQKDLFALTEEHELGMMSSMVTISYNAE